MFNDDKVIVELIFFVIFKFMVVDGSVILYVMYFFFNFKGFYKLKFLMVF